MITKEEYPRLCGGTFFTLVLRAKKRRVKVRNSESGKNDGLTQTNCLKDLIKIFYPNFEVGFAGTTFSQNASAYRTCALSQGSYLPFDQKTLLDRFNDRVINQYIEVAMLMDRFVEKYVDTENNIDDLMNSLLNIIEEDQSIADSDVFYVTPYKMPMSKKDMKNVTNICVPTFLLGIWHYIVMNRPDNTVGARTIESWSELDAGGNKSRTRQGIIGKKKRNLSYEVYYNHRKDRNRHKSTEVCYEETVVETDFSKYLNKAYEKYSEMKTLLYKDQPKRFKDFYVCNDVVKKERQYSNASRFTYTRITDIKVADLFRRYEFLIITGTGGLGKSMMMRHLLLNAVENYESLKLLPVFVPLKDYKQKGKDLFGYAFEKITALADNITEEQFIQVLMAGRCLLLLDGLDEIQTELRRDFESSLEVFTDKYTDNLFVISSRPYSSFISFSRFRIFELQPFTKDQAIKLVERLDFREDEPAIKENFLKRLKGDLYKTHREFTENPLLLTIMLITYEQFANIPRKMHIFYRDAFSALAQRHDASKGGFQRSLQTGLTADRFEAYFEEFCARSYFDEKFELTELEMSYYFDRLKERTRNPDENKVTVQQFIEDLINGMCLMYYENASFHFTHRSFQEYFCAAYFSKQKDRALGRVGEFFEKRRRRGNSDTTFDMLYDMIPDKIEEFILIPYIEDFKRECENNSGYLTYLCKLYPVINYTYGDAIEDYYGHNEPSSFIYSFLRRNYNFEQDIDDLPIDYYEEFVTKEFCYVESGQDEYDLVDMDELSDEKREELNHQSRGYDEEGYALEISVEDLIEDTDNYSEVLRELCYDSFPMKLEYYALWDLLDEMKKRQHHEDNGDLFDLF